VVQPANVDLTSPRLSPLSELNKPKGKPGRPSREEIARRQAEAAAEGRVYVSSVRKRNQPKNSKGSRPLRSPLPWIVKNIAESPHIPSPSNISAGRATATAVLPEEGDNVRNCTSEDSSLDREAFSDSNAEIAGHSDRHSDTSYDDGTTPPNPTEQSVVSAVARRLVDGWVSQRQSSNVEEASKCQDSPERISRVTNCKLSVEPEFPRLVTCCHVSKRAKDGDDADD
jgi:hypothetical protein